MPTMPNIVGLELETAQNTLQAAGVVNPLTLGYFGTWPINVTWVSRAPLWGQVLSQSPSSGATVTANASISLTCAGYPMGVVYP